MKLAFAAEDGTMWPGDVLAAMVTAGCSILTTLVGGFYLNIKLEREKTANATAVENYKILLEHQRDASKRRQEGLSVLLNAASMARSGAEGMVAAAHLQPTQQDVIFERIAKAVEQLSQYVRQVKKTALDVYLTRGDVELALRYQRTLMALFSVFNLQVCGSSSFITDMQKLFADVDRAFTDLRDHFLKSRTTLADDSASSTTIEHVTAKI